MNSQYMANIGKKILKSQNQANHIDDLLAQKTIYSIAKSYQGLLIFTTVNFNNNKVRLKSN